MVATITPFDGTARKFLRGDFNVGDTYKINLYSDFNFDSTATTKTAAETGATQLASANGYLQNDRVLANVTVTTVDDDGAMFDADDVVWTASGGPISAAYALIYNDTDPDDAPLVYIDFGSTITAVDGATLSVIFSANGILRILTP